ncbi:MAG: hypothetical protein PHI34_14595 [Acidobacteriota bacterium]|nr:hypothetical protein [Acidobacteriota bacterium]
MSRAKIIRTLAILAVVTAAACSSPSSSTSSTAEKATFTMDVGDYAQIYLDSADGLRHFKNNLIIESTNDVDGTITSLTVSWYIGDALIAYSEHDGGSFTGEGSLELAFDSTCDAAYRAEKSVIRVVGTDENAYAIDQSETYTWIWNYIAEELRAKGRPVRR